MNIIQDNNWVITTKKGKGKLSLFCGNVEWIILIHGRGPGVVVCLPDNLGFGKNEPLKINISTN